MYIICFVVLRVKNDVEKSALAIVEAFGTAGQFSPVNLSFLNTRISPALSGNQHASVGSHVFPRGS